MAHFDLFILFSDYVSMTGVSLFVKYLLLTYKQIQY